MTQNGYLELTSLTWDKETHGLFDYDSKLHYHRKFFTITDSCSLYRSLNTCHIQPPSHLENSIGLLHIERKSSDYQISLIPEPPSNKMWLVISRLPKPALGYKLSEGDWLKLGRIRFKVIKICTQPGKTENNLLPQFFGDERGEHEAQNESVCEKTACRICLCEGESQIDPLICPCHCAGTMKFIHLNCLKEWLKSKITAKVSDKGMSFHIKDLVCELCKGNFPLVLQYKEQRISLISIDFPDKAHVILEEFRPEQNQRHALHLVTLNSKQSAVIGRGHDCEIKIGDISVSRKHCKISLNGEQFFVEDCKSKFGTLVKVKKSFLLKPKYNITVQINRTVVTMEYKIPWTLNTLCKCCDSQRMMSESFTYLTQPEFHDSESDLENSRLHLTNSQYRSIH